MENHPKSALVTGASLGLGKAFAEECAARGMDLLLVALPGSGLAEVGESIARDAGVRVECLEADLTDPECPGRIARRLEEARFELDLLINNAGIGALGFFAESAIARHEATIDLNVRATVRLIHALVPHLLRRKRPSILNVGSLGAFFPMPYLPTYSATKSFVVHFSLALREELAGRIGVSVLCPNTIKTTKETADYVDRLPFPCRHACLFPGEVARAALDGLEKNRAIIVPGFLNKLLFLVGPLVPRSLVMRVIRRFWGNYELETRGAPA